MRAREEKTEENTAMIVFSSHLRCQSGDSKILKMIWSSTAGRCGSGEIRPKWIRRCTNLQGDVDLRFFAARHDVDLRRLPGCRSALPAGMQWRRE
ncbi:hypothetical protein Cni_G04956 [Canna indica]|uniref:Uncharacterized protein n=1 Tax=Canna indica TaxID=4628 RepID=A0AAQ3Q382_9LILI|nr:hypothetical protein Cni_G04956 [Canna indica]